MTDAVKELLDYLLQNCQEHKRAILVQPIDDGNGEISVKILPLPEKQEEKENNVVLGPNIDVDERIANLIHTLGIPAHIKGYQYLKRALSMCINDMTLLNQVTNVLYRSIADEFKTTPTRVERALRYAIELGFSRGSQSKFEEIFGYTISPEKGKPTNIEFIAYITDMIRREYKMQIS